MAEQHVVLVTDLLYRADLSVLLMINNLGGRKGFPAYPIERLAESE